MKVQQVSARGFMSHQELNLVLPASGVVLVTGPNGAGKSAIVEAVSYALWGKTVRGSDPRRSGEAGLAMVVADSLTARRRWTEKGTNKLEVLGEGHESSTKAQERVSAVLEWDVWRRSCTFSSADVSSFTSASDAERKRLLESLLGLDALGAAHDRARADLRQTEQTLDMAKLETARAEEAYGLAQKQVSVRQRIEGIPPDLTNDDMARNLSDTEALADAAQRDLDAARLEHAELRAQHREAGRSLEAHRAAAKALEERVCPTCRRRFDEPGHDPAILDAAISKVVEAQVEVDRLAFLMEEQRMEGLKRAEAAHVSKADVGRVARAAARVALLWQEWDQQEQLKVEAQNALAVATQRLGQAKAVQEDIIARAEVQRAACQVLGTRGVRSQVLARSLGQLESSANRWLAAIGDRGITVKLSPQVERKSGSVADVVALEVLGAGGGHGYRAASAGERRRVDVALTLALSDLAGSAHGTSGSTLFMDEVFDALDREGCRAVASALAQVAERRCVVVVSHSAALAEELAPAVRVEVAAGSATVRSRA